MKSSGRLPCPDQSDLRCRRCPPLVFRYLLPSKNVGELGSSFRLVLSVV